MFEEKKMQRAVAAVQDSRFNSNAHDMPIGITAHDLIAQARSVCDLTSRAERLLHGFTVNHKHPAVRAVTPRDLAFAKRPETIDHLLDANMLKQRSRELFKKGALSHLSPTDFIKWVLRHGKSLSFTDIVVMNAPTVDRNGERCIFVATDLMRSGRPLINALPVGRVEIKQSTALLYRFDDSLASQSIN